MAELNPLPASGPHLGSSAHERAALGARRSYTQLHAGGSSNTISGMLNVQAEQQHAAGQQHGRLADKQQHEHQQQADKQQHSQQASSLAPSEDSSSAQQLDRTNSSQHSSSGSYWPGPLVQGAPFAVCQTGAKFPAYVSSGVQLGSFDDRYTHFYSISPDACTNPTIYWLGR